MKRLRIVYIILVIIMIITGCAKSSNSLDNDLDETKKEIQKNVDITDIDVTEEVSPSVNPTLTIVPTTTPNPTVPPTPTATLRPTAAPSPTVTPKPTATPSPTPSPTPTPKLLTQEQTNSLAMLNYLTVLLQNINDKKNNKVFLEEAYASIIDNIDPTRIDEETQSYVKRLLNTIERYRMIEVKRERLKYINEQNKARAIKAALPNPIGLLSTVSSFSLDRIATSVLYMAIDSVASYKAYEEEIEEAYLQEGWALDDEAMENFHISRVSAFDYMINIVRDKEIDKKYSYMALNEDSVKAFVENSNKDNLEQRILFFESNESTYDSFGLYWLELVKCYYEKGEDKKCIDAMKKYESLQTDIFRQDYYYAKYIPYVILAAERYYDSNKKLFANFALEYTKLLVDNSNKTDWSARYFAAQTYMKISVIEQNKKYLNYAFEIVKNNINNGLISEQQKLNKTYLSEVKEVTIPDDAEKKEETDIEDYNKSLKEKRKTELPPVYEPLIVNLDLLFALADDINISQEEKTRINTMLHGNGGELFLSKVLENQYTFDSEDIKIVGKLTEDSIRLPVDCLSENWSIRAEVKNNGITKAYSLWKIESVVRENENVSSFYAIFGNDYLKNEEWNVGTPVTVIISDTSSGREIKKELYFKVKEIKKKYLVYSEPVFVQVKKL